MIRRILIICLACALAVLAACDRQDTQGDLATEPDQVSTGQLPGGVEPLHYRLELAIIPSQTSFSGRTEIDVRIDRETRRIHLHGKDLVVSRSQLRLANGEIIEADYRQVHDSGVVELELATAAMPGEATLVFEYAAPFNESLEGLYRVRAGDDDYAFTQFEATSARLVFPGFDEPRFKVSFDITVEVEARHKLVGNTPPIAEEMVGDDRRRVRLATTRPLPTYLLAFAVGELDEVVAAPVVATTLRPEPLPLRGFTVRGKGQEIEYALENTQRMLLYLEDYFGTAYPYRKLDIIAVPDFRAGAMENAGAITYREQYILLNASSPAWQRRTYAVTHAHELAHQWFGNLVTPLWWNDIWLNEAFATWLSYKAMDSLEPESGHQQSRRAAALRGMGVDSLAGARQIRQPIDTHGDIAAAFDSITYQKGGAVLSMFERFIGEEAFREGIRHYMDVHRFGNTDAHDFIRAIAAQRPDLPDGLVEKAFFSFLDQPGTPYVALALQCGENDVRVQVSQSRYLPLGSSANPDQQWILPLCLGYEKNGARHSQCALVNEPVSSVKLDTDHCPAYLIPNADGAGYYRWSLAEADWQPLLEGAPLSEAELLAAADSLGAAFRRGTLETAAYLGAVPYLLESDNREVVATPLGDLRFLREQVVPPVDREKVEQLIDRLYRAKYEAFSPISAQSSERDIRLSSLLHRVIAHDADDQELQAQLAASAREFLGQPPGANPDPGKINPNLRQSALNAAVKQSDTAFAREMLHAALASADALLRQQILTALGKSDDDALLANLRNLILDERLRANELRYIVRPQMARAEKREAMWNWILQNLDAVLARLPFDMGGTVVNYAASFCDRAWYRAVADSGSLFTALPQGERSLANTLERIALCYELKDFHRAGAADYFSWR